MMEEEGRIVGHVVGRVTLDQMAAANAAGWASLRGIF